jgi:hypothetical protein
MSYSKLLNHCGSEGTRTSDITFLELTSDEKMSLMTLTDTRTRKSTCTPPIGRVGVPVRIPVHVLVRYRYF